MFSYTNVDEISRKTVFETFKGMGWSFTSVDNLILASKLLPFSLVWPTIAYPRVYSTDCTSYAEVNLEVEDIDGKALLCKACELQWIDLNKSPSCHIAGTYLSALFQKSSGETLRCGKMKIHVGQLFRTETCPDLKKCVSHRVLLRGFSGQKKKGNGFERRVSKEEKDRDLIGDELLERLQQENGEFRRGKPAWQLFLVFLSRQKCLAWVTISDGRSLSFDAILEPLTVHTAILNVLDTRVLLASCIPSKDIDFKGDCSLQAFTKTYVTEPQANPDLEAFCSVHVSAENNEAQESCGMKVGSACKQSSTHKQDTATSSLKCRSSKKSGRIELPRECRSSKGALHHLCDTWDSFYTAIVGGLCEADPKPGSALRLENRYIKSSCRQSKVMRFLSHWMRKSARKVDATQTFELKFNQLQLNSQQVEEGKADSHIVLDKTLQSASECEQYCSASAASHSVINAPLSIKAADCIPVLVNSDHAEASIELLQDKIQHGLCNKEVDLKALAKRLVDVLVQNLQMRLEDRHSFSTDLVEKVENSNEPRICDQMMKLLLKKPKELATKYEGCQLWSRSQEHGDSTGSFMYTSEDKVREHELQVLFRMEILASKVAGSIEDHVKDKLIKEICRLLQNIQFYLPGGIFKGESLIEFADRVIASRYKDSLEQVISRIYRRMEFYAHDESGDFPTSVSDHEKDSEVHKKEGDAEISSQNELMATNCGERKNLPQLSKAHLEIPSTEDQHLQSSQEEHEGARMHPKNHVFMDDYEYKLKKAQSKRERAKRFAHFASRAPDLQRIWAPKQPSQSKKKQSKVHANLPRKKRMKDSEDDVVYETPIPTSKVRKYNQTKVDVVCETPYPTSKVRNHEARSTVGVVHETPFLTSKAQCHGSEGAMAVDYPRSGTIAEQATSGIDLNSGSISRALFGKRKALQGSVFTSSDMSDFRLKEKR